MKHTLDHSLAVVHVEARGDVPHVVDAYARRKVEALFHLVSRPILFARITLTQAADPAVERPAIAEVNLDVNGRLVRAQVAAPTMHQAVDLVEARLRERLERMLPDWESRRGSRPVGEPGEWRHSDAASQRPDYYPRPAEERRIVQRKSFTLPMVTPDEAAFDMAMLDYDFLLFTDAGSGQDSVLAVLADGYYLQMVRPLPDKVGTTAIPLAVSDQPAPRLSVDDAVRRLNLTGAPFVFFQDRATGRGAVLYHRYDGHYGLIGPAA